MPTSGIGSRTARPATITVPRVAGRNPATMRSRVDFPQPLGPTSETNSPFPTDNEMPARASTGPLAVGYDMSTRSRPIRDLSTLVRIYSFGVYLLALYLLALYLGMSTLVKKSAEYTSAHSTFFDRPM